MFDDLVNHSSNKSQRKVWKRLRNHNPMVSLIKQEVLMYITGDNKYGDWIETGTYKGHTSMFLSEVAKHVYTCEASKECYDHAIQKLSTIRNITAVHGKSSDCLDSFLEQSGDIVNIFLDAHWSGFGVDGTDNDMYPLTYKGHDDPPVIQELDVISKHLNNKKVTIVIDDFRCFVQESKVKGYPDPDAFIDWGKKYGFHWNVMQDLFILKNYV